MRGTSILLLYLKNRLVIQAFPSVLDSQKQVINLYVFERNLDRWNKNIQNMVDSQTDFQLITTFNEWGEGTAVENAVDWNSRSGYGGYLDALHWDGMLPPLLTNTPGNHIVGAYPDFPVYLKQ